MRNLLLVLFYLFVLVGCGEGHPFFTAIEKSPFTPNDGPFDIPEKYIGKWQAEDNYKSAYVISESKIYLCHNKNLEEVLIESHFYKQDNVEPLKINNKKFWYTFEFKNNKLYITSFFDNTGHYYTLME